MAAVRVGVVQETALGERRVALTPDSVSRLQGADVEVLVASGAGARAWFPDEDYAEAGAAVVDTDTLFARADIVLCVNPPPPQHLRSGQAVVGLLQPLLNPRLMADLAERGVTAISLDGLPRTLSRAQSMDALSSQANIAAL